ncbi:hypothetical protein D3C73_1447150 [compost metagenome]
MLIAPEQISEDFVLPAQYASSQVCQRNRKAHPPRLRAKLRAEVIAYCQGPLCVYSALAVQKLQQNGYKAYRMEEGINEWQGHVMPH